MGIPGYFNPVKHIHGLTAERIDQGVDYSGSGPLVAMASGHIRATNNAGWPGGGFIVLEPDSGPYSGKFIYYAEDITPHVHVGEHVKGGQTIGYLHGGMEIGFGQGASGESLARAHGQVHGGIGAGESSTAFGKLMSDLIHSLGGPAGKASGRITGSVPKGWKHPSGGGGGGGGGGSYGPALGLDSGLSSAPLPIPGLGFLGSVLPNITGAGKTVGDIGTSISGISKGLEDILHLSSALFQPQLWLRVGAFVAGLVAFLFAIYLLGNATGANKKIESGAQTAGMAAMMA